MNQIRRDAVANGVPPLWRLVSRKGNAIVPFSETGDGPPLYYVHPVSGEVMNFGSLARAIGPEQRLYAIQVPRSNMSMEFAASVEQVARQYVRSVVAFQPDGPIVLAGWSAGAIIALEMAQQLLALGRDVPLLVALDGAPSNTGGGISRRNPAYAWRLLRNLPGWVRCEIRQSGSVSAGAREIGAKLARRFRKTLRVRNSQTLDGEAVQSLLDSTEWLSGQKAFIQALYDALSAYVPRPYPGRVILFEARTQRIDHLFQMGAAWRSIATRTEIVTVDANHDTMFQEPAIGEVAAHLRPCLAELRDACRADIWPRAAAGCGAAG